MKKCSKCGVVSNHCVRIAPINKDGSSLSNAHLCPNCRKAWGKVFEKNCMYVTSANFKSMWAKYWEKFMENRYVEPEVVLFT